MVDSPPIDIELYKAPNGDKPLKAWLDSIRDKSTRARLNARITAIKTGNLGDWKAITGAAGICEMRMDFGPGYRVYFARKNQKFVILLCGSVKDDQNAVIVKAKEYWAEYQNRS